MFSVTPCPARFLVVRFDAAGHVVVHDETEVRFVDAHAERVGRDDDRRFSRHELLLNRPTLIGSEAAMIKGKIAIDVGAQ